MIEERDIDNHRGVLPPHTVRIKRKRNQDPLQALLLGQQQLQLEEESSKRSRTNSYVFKLAATEEFNRHVGAVTLLEAQSDDSVSVRHHCSQSMILFFQTNSLTDKAKDISMKNTRKSLTRLFKFPKRKRQSDNDNTVKEPLSKKASSIALKDKIKSDSNANSVASPVSIQPSEPSVTQSPRRPNGIPKVKVLDHSPERPKAIPYTRRRRSSTLSLSPTNSYVISNANEEELQKMVDQYLSLNHDVDADKSTHVLKRPHRQSGIKSKSLTDSGHINGTESPAHKVSHISGTSTHTEAHSKSLERKLADVSAIDTDNDDYVYDVYFREKFIEGVIDTSQYGMVIYNSTDEFDNILFDEYIEEDTVGSDDEDSNAEDFYKNDYPDEDEGDDVNEIGNGIGFTDGEDDDDDGEVDADDIDD
ncbi:hypothetical protein V1511DRAFT_178301 [Dipodascopsis uninucleata]